MRQSSIQKFFKPQKSRVPLGSLAINAAGFPGSSAAPSGKRKFDEMEDSAGSGSAAASGPAAPPTSGSYTKGEYHKLSNHQAAMIFDPLQEFRLSLLYLNQGSLQWELLGPGDRALQKSFSMLNSSQLVVYYTLISCLRDFVGDHVGVDQFNQPQVQFVYNWPTWHRAILKASVSCNNTVKSELDCFFSNCRPDKYGRPLFNIRPGQIEKRNDANKNSRNRWTFYNIEGLKNLQTTLGRIMTVISNGIPPTSNSQGSHLCYNHPQKCFNPKHLIWESDSANKGRNGCVGGHAKYCQHRPKCVYTNSAGRFLPHRNLGYDRRCDCKDMDCEVPLGRALGSGVRLGSGLVGSGSGSSES